jgi:hypothetical protein
MVGDSNHPQVGLPPDKVYGFLRRHQAIAVGGVDMCVCFAVHSKPHFWPRIFDITGIMAQNRLKSMRNMCENSYKPPFRSRAAYL